MGHCHSAWARVTATALLLLVLLVACGKSDGPTSTKGSDQPASSDGAFAFYADTSASTFYLFSLDCHRGVRVTGRLFVVLKKDAAGGVIDCEIGMSAVTQTPLSLPPGDQIAFWEPMLPATNIDYRERLGLSGNVALLSSWSNPYDHFKSAMTNGTNAQGQKTFNFRQGNSPGIGYNEYWAFAHGTASIGGYVMNTDKTYCLGRDSDTGGDMPLHAKVKN